MSGSTPNIAPEPALPGVPDAMPDYSGYLHVAAAVIEDGAGRILLARRPAHLHQGGLWEFPGGKVEAGEAVSGALARELKEELGIRVTRAAPLIRIPYAYPDRRVLLDVWRVSAYEGAAYGAEGQVVKWVERKRLRDYAFPAANQPIVAAAMLPARYLITPDPGTADTWPAFLSHLQARMEQGIRLVQLRAKQLNGAEYGELARRVIALGREYGTTVMLNTSPAFARELDADGLHLSSRSLRTLQERPLGAERWLAASCHNLEELRHAMAIGVDFAVLSPVKPTTSHPGARALGWDAFHRITEHSGIPLYALGGMEEADIDTARVLGGQGIAAISSLWGRCG